MRHRLLAPFSLGLSALALSALLSSAACSSSSSTSSTTTGTGGGTTGSGGGPVAGPADAHCGATVQTVSQSACSDPGTGGSAAGGGGAGGMMMEEMADVMYNAEGDDDDCKYHMKWSSTAVAQNQDVTFTLTLTTKSDGKPATGAAPDIEAFLDDTHPAPNSDQKPTEGDSGTYTIGPMRFDAAGKWTVRFHVYDTCSDFNEESPHSHGAFFLQVP